MRRKDPFSTAFGSARPKSVYGWKIAEPRITWTGLRLAAVWLGPPLLLAVLGLDVLVYLIGLVAFDACWAIWCLF